MKMIGGDLKNDEEGNEIYEATKVDTTEEVNGVESIVDNID